MMATEASRDVIINENTVGTTFWDLQSNALISNKIHCYDDGTIAAVWTMGMQATSFPDRGTGINYFDGVNWGPAPQARIETLRTAFPSYAPLGPDGEITFVTTSTGFPMTYREMGLSTMPAISIGQDNTVVVIYSSTTETYDNFDWNYKKLWMRFKPEGVDWSPFVHLTRDIMHLFDESIYACAFPTWDDRIHLVYNNDGSPGTAYRGDHDYQENRITYMNIELYPIGIDEGSLSQQDKISLVVSPNPSSGLVKVGYTVDQISNINLLVRDITGKKLLYQDLGWKINGTYNYTIDLKDLEPGIYLVSIISVNETATSKLVLQR